MDTQLDRLEAKIRSLPASDRARLLDRLIVDWQADDAVARECQQLARIRADEYLVDQSVHVPGEQVFAEIDAELASAF